MVKECSQKDCGKEHSGTWASSLDGFTIEVHFCDAHENDAEKVITRIWGLKDTNDS